MGRGYIVEDAVEGYLSKLCEQQPGPVTGLLIGQVTLSLTSVCRLAFPSDSVVWLPSAWEDANKLDVMIKTASYRSLQ